MQIMRLTFPFLAFLFLLFALAACTSGPPPPIQELDYGWIRLNGEPAEDRPFIDIGGCIPLGDPPPSLAVQVGRGVSGATSVEWTVSMGEWNRTEAWLFFSSESPMVRDAVADTGAEWVASPPDRSLGYQLLREAVAQDAQVFTIDMGTVYTFPMTPDVRERLANAWPKCWPKEE